MSATGTAADQSLLEMIAADERSLLRTGAVARELLARHSDLPLHGARLKYGGEIHLKAPTAEDVRAWAARLDADVTEHTDDPGYGPFRHTDVVTVIDGVQVHVWHCRVLSEAEAAAWRESEGRS
ncbi:hypothetical protein ADL28_08875 [Streptomyces violaceusniger]|uniref:SnoaL-like domain-containing protein n=2 Tax=Streptomyces violaceusniger group TaxID=2839105 RepID=A0ABD5JI35_9ACTN|nr:hypothetical protein [Streptomyces violaceusniger]KUL64787.1 hypothetical protein ADL28_08875 [Streptomyces violaceusniger]MEE4588065.1 hypothetical protein [Streptomyces sp. DSM 41602]